MALTALLLLAQASLAQVSIQATVSKTDAALDDQIVLAVTVSGEQASLPEPQLPPLPNFSIYSSGRNQSISFVNGRVSSSVVHTFILVPRFVGKGTIGPITATADGHTARTEPIEIRVRKPADPSSGAVGAQPPTPHAGATPPAAGAAPSDPAQGTPHHGADLFVTARLDKTRAFVDEQVTLTVRFHSAVSLLGNSEYAPPSLTGFLTEDLPPVRSGMTTIGGRPYRYSEVRTAIFPAQAGRLTIGRATVRAQVQREVGLDPFAPDFFDRFFSAGLLAAQTREVRSEPLTLEVLPLPAGKPAGFAGAVGRFALEASLDRSRAKVGEAVTLTVRVSGAGNLKALGTPTLPELAGFKAYETVASLSIDKSGDRVHGSKEFKTVLVPRASGELSVPPISFSFFDPGERAYKTLSTKPLSLRADPADPGAAPVAFVPGAAPAGPAVRAVSTDIRYVKTASSRPLASRWLARVAQAGPLHSVPVAAFVVGLGAAWRRRRREKDPAATRFREAREKALRRLEKGEAAALSDALAGYLADKLASPAAGLTAKRAAELLRRRWPALKEERLREIQDLWRAIDAQRFAPGGEDDAGLRSCRESLSRLIEALEKELR